MSRTVEDFAVLAAGATAERVRLDEGRRLLSRVLHIRCQTSRAQPGGVGATRAASIGARRRHSSNSNTANRVSIPGKRGPGPI